MRQIKLAVADRLERYADRVEESAAVVPTLAAAVTFVVVSTFVAVDLGPKAAAARALARRLRRST